MQAVRQPGWRQFREHFADLVGGRASEPLISLEGLLEISEGFGWAFIEVTAADSFEGPGFARRRGQVLVDTHGLGVVSARFSRVAGLDEKVAEVVQSLRFAGPRPQSV